MSKLSVLSISKDFLALGYVETQVFVQITLNEDATTAAISREKKASGRRR